jgi:hypothetical protein
LKPSAPVAPKKIKEENEKPTNVMSLIDVKRPKKKTTFKNTFVCSHITRQRRP